jgi:YfiH family protein
MSTRHGGVSTGPWGALNLGVACADDPAHVTTNRQRFAAALGAQPVWLRQVHGTAVLRLEAGSISADLPPADAAWTTATGIACAVQVADCLPVLLSTRDGRAVAAAHAGWRGLAAGVLQATVASMQQGAGVQPGELLAWLGPCIGPAEFEVGADDLQACAQDPAAPDPRFFLRHDRADGSKRWLADLPAMAGAALQQAGVPVQAIRAAGRCTVAEPSDFFSFRRDGITGRMAAGIWRVA